MNIQIRTSYFAYSIVFFVFFGLYIPSTWAQNTDGTEFWVTFGKNWREDQPETVVIPRIRIVSNDVPTHVDIVFTDIATGNSLKTISFDMSARDIKDVVLDNSDHTGGTTQKDAVYITAQGKNNKSIHITSNNPVTAYALNQCDKSADATNILPVPTLGMEYYQISYTPQVYYEYQDAYAVIATEDGTNVYHNGVLLPNMPLNTGQVYYRTDYDDMTGAKITSDKPVAYYAMCQGTWIKYQTSRDCLFQQLAPVNTWGNSFLVPPISHIDGNSIERVRIVASQDTTTITRTGGMHIFASPGVVVSGSTYIMNSGQYVEIEITSNNDNGCYIDANKPIGVCSYLTTPPSANELADPAQAWFPSIEQTTKNALLAPFAPQVGTSLLYHRVIIITPTNTKNDTKVTIGTGEPTNLSGEEWRDNVASNMSFYSYPLTNTTESYNFTNPTGMIAMGYGYGLAESYYYLAYSAMHNLSAFFTISICEGDSYDFFGEILTEAGEYFHNVGSAAGGDSIVTLNLIVNQNYTISISESICQGDSYDFYGKILTETGEYSYNFGTTAGCDSIIVLSLTVNQNYTIPISETICEGDSYDFYGEILTEMGEYSYNFGTTAGCDSIVVLTLTVNQNYTVPISESICEGDSYDFYGEILTESGEYSYNVGTTAGCDSIVVLTLTVNQNYTVSISETICEGDSYDFYGEILTETGEYSYNVGTTAGCDSTVLLTLTVNPAYSIPITYTMCQGDSYDFYGQILTESGEYIEPFQTVDECDSLIILTLTVNPVYTFPISESICQGDSYDFHGEILTENGTYTDTLTAVITGCDSIVVLTLTVNLNYTVSISESICEGDSYDFHGEILTEAGEYSHNVGSTTGCDSIVTLHLTINPVYTTSISETICDYDSYNFYGEILTTAGEYNHILQTKTGCDSTIVLTLKVTSTEFNIGEVNEICADDLYFCVPTNYISTEMISYNVHFNNNALDEKFENFSSTIDGKSCLEIKIPNYNTKEYVRPYSDVNHYTAYISVNDGKCFSDTLEVPFQILYPSWIMEQKWNDVIALLNERYNGGYLFSNYEWYKDGLKLLGENGPYIYFYPDLDYGTEYRALLTRDVTKDDGETCFTCSLIAEYRSNIKVYPQSVSKNEPVFVETQEDGIVVVWDVLGRQIAQYPIVENQVNILNLKATGFLLLQVIQNNGYTQTFKIIVH